MTDDESERIRRKLERELGPNFYDMPKDEMLRIAASNAFHNGKALKDIRYGIIILIGMGTAILGKLFGYFQ